MGLWEIIKGEQPGLLHTLRHYENAGQFGEYLICYALKRKLTGNFRLFQNVYLPCGRGYTELDLVLIHEKGIFVIESKNYSGWIRAGYKYWTQTLMTGHTIPFYSPVLQNQTHLRALSRYFRIPEEEIVSLIVFSERCTLKKVPKNTNSLFIFKRPKLLRTLHKFMRNRPIQYSPQQLEVFYKHISTCCNVSKRIQKQHIQRISSKYTLKSCPLCGGSLVKRSGKYGDFLGCSNYPKCHYTRRLEK